MAISEVVPRPFGEAVSPTAGDTASDDVKSAAPTAGSRTTAFLVATLLTFGSVGALGYTQWWLPREKAQQVAKVNYQRCLDEVKVYKGKKSYKGRLAQCSKFLAE